MTYNQRFDQVVLGTKYLDWAYEREYRLISRKRGKHLLDPASLVGVLCGAKMAASRKEELRAQVNACVPHVSFVDAALDKSSGGVSIPEFTNAVIPVQISSWRMLDDQLGQGREIGSGELIARPAPVCASKAFKMHSWVFRYRLKRKRSAKPISTPMN
jgi:hypothetical protein